MMQHFEPDAMSYASSNGQKIARIEELLNLEPLMIILTLVKDINTQLAVLETRLKRLEKENG